MGTKASYGKWRKSRESFFGNNKRVESGNRENGLGKDKMLKCGREERGTLVERRIEEMVENG
jgi:hypothetical protein